MYVPKHFAEPDVAVMHALMRAHPLAAVVVHTPQGLEANHVPLVLHEAPGGFGTLRGHVARANPLASALASGADALAIFTGPDAYVTPSWYASKREHGRVVPTWNYAVVHAHGALRAMEDPAWLLAHLEALTATHEGSREAPWRVSDAPAEFVAGLTKAIVGFEMPVARLEGKWKVSQNRSSADREGVAAGLAAESAGPGDDAAAMSDAVREALKRER